MKFTGRNIQIRDLESQDIGALIEWLHPHHQWHRLNGPYYPPMPAEEIPAVVSKWVSADQNSLRRRVLVADAQTNDVLGMVSRYWISEETNWTALGIVIYNPRNWGKGYGYEALGLWCDYLFESEPKFVRLDLRTWSGNTGMIKLAEKLGFLQEARFRMARIVDGQYYDGLGYGILRDEWQQAHPDGFATSLTHP